ncbi:MAG: site-specific integrase [Rhodocyclaceae bacterium]|nr:site-specific integrase [Rhodocyclaceae bacterium]MBP6109443.1 site-specific integrase [Rhodocyclaceae bacterium]MBP6279126.1 site-specific integrase [Rhodocyclaceae bacterium]
MEFADGLEIHPAYGRTQIAIYFDNDYGLLEEPSRWMMTVAKLKSRSKETSRNYAYILARYLNWLDDAGYGCAAWQAIDEDIFDEYLKYLSKRSASDEPMDHSTIVHYASRILDFYAWAKKQGYDHFLDVDVIEVDRRINKHQDLLAHVRSSTKVAKYDFNTPTGRPALHQREMNKFVTQPDYEASLGLFDDPVYAVIAAVIRTTAMRPKDVLQLPYRGKLQNSDFVPYDADGIPANIDNLELHYFFESKGKNRSIAFPGALWRAICSVYIPLRRQRAELFRAMHGVSPPNSVLFLNQAGHEVTYQMIYRHFAKVPEVASQAKSAYKGKRYTPRMLRHACATYFVYDALKKKNRLGDAPVYDASLDEELRKLLGHEDVKTTYMYYVHLVNRFFYDDLLQDTMRARVDDGITALLKRFGT